MEQFKDYEELLGIKLKPRITIVSIVSAQLKGMDYFKPYQNAQRIWKGISFEHIGWMRLKTSIKSTNIGQESLYKNVKLKALYDQVIEYFLIRKVRPDVIIIYLPGVGFKGITGGLALAYDTKKPPYLIVVSESAGDYPWVVAHEIGHVLYYSNRYHDKKDPNPYLLVNARGEPIRDKQGNLKYDHAHNNNKNNIMYPRASKSTIPPKVTSAQLKKASQSYLLKRIKLVT
ncbi:hypothetical protein [Pseudoneobacillus sp. C159]